MISMEIDESKENYIGKVKKFQVRPSMKNI